jgi:hypothetical protein
LAFYFSLLCFLPHALQKKDETMQEKINQELRKIEALLRSVEYNNAMAQTLEAAYSKNIGKDVLPFLSQDEDTAANSFIKNEKIAINVAGFYALECGLNYFAAQGKLPSNVLMSVVNNSISKDDKILLQRFANATWKAGQPFRGLDRIERENFVPFDFLSEEEKEKDWVQIKVAAEKLLNDIK